MTTDLDELERLLKEIQTAQAKYDRSDSRTSTRCLQAKVCAQRKLDLVAADALPGLIRRVREAESRADKAEGLIERIKDFAEIHEIYSLENEFSGAWDALQSVCPADLSKLTIRKE